MEQDSKEIRWWEIWITKANLFLSKPLGMLIGFVVVILAVVLFFTIRGASSQHKAVEIGENTNAIVRNTEDILNVQKDTIARLEKAVEELKQDAAFNRKIIACLLEAHGETSVISPEDRQSCEQPIQLDETQNHDASFSPSANSSFGSSSNTTTTSSTSDGTASNSPEQPSGIQGIFQSIIDTTQSILDFINPLARS